MKKILAILVVMRSLHFGLDCQMAHAQSNLPKTVQDSLWSVWHDPQQADTNRLNAINRIAGLGYLHARPDSAFYFAQQQYAFAKQKRALKYMAGALNIQGASLWIRGEHTEAIGYYERSLNIHRAIGNKKGMATTLGNIGLIYKGQGDHVKAIEHYDQSLRISEAIGDKKGMAATLSNIGVIYDELDDLNSALDYHTRSMRLREELDDKYGIATSLNNIGLVYKERGDLTKALDYQLRSLEVSKEIGHKKDIANALNNIGLLYGIQGQYAQAIDYHQQSLSVRQELGDKGGMANALGSIAGIHNLQGQYAQALDPAKQALALAQEVREPRVIKEAALQLYEVYKATGQPATALKMHELFVTMRDSLISEENQREVIRQQLKYDFEKQAALSQLEQEKKDLLVVEQLKRQDQQRKALMGGMVLMLGLAGVSYRSYRQKKRDNAQIIREKARSEELLLNILPAEVAEELKEKGHADAQLIDHTTVLFTDFKGFTQLSETLSPQELVRDLNECFSAFDRICAKHGIEKIKTIGDAYMAAGGLPTASTTHGTDVVRAALEMRDFIAEGKARKVAAGRPYFEIRIGIHTGPVVAGIVGVKKFQYDIWGDTVNTASRMESSGEVGKVNISETTYELVKDQFACEYRGKVEAKGKGLVSMYFVG
jgi:adenylate cyclase